MSTEDRVKAIRDSMPSAYRGLFDRVMSGKGGKANAIKLQCIECYGYKYAVSAGCTIKTCPLFHHNPYRKRAEGRKSHTYESGSKELCLSGSKHPENQTGNVNP